jgi:gliding motility-associated-like protein
MKLFHRFVFVPFILPFAGINFSFSQSIILTTGNKLLSLDPDSGICAVKEIRSFCNPYFLSAALFKDTLYYIGSDNRIYMSVLGDSTFCKTFNVSTSSNALTVDKEGNLYWFEDISGDLVKLNPHTGEGEDLGHVNYPSAGDLIFYKDKLYLASYNMNLVEINLQDPAKSTVYMNTPGYSFFGLVNIPVGCSQNKVFGVEPDTSDLRLSHLIEIDMENKKIGRKFCSVPYIILDAASITENGTYKVDINSVNVRSDCIPGSDNNTIVVNATTASSDSINFSLDDTVKNISGIFQNIGKGVYHISAEAAGCTVDTMVTVKDVVPPQLEVSILPPDCFSRANGSIQLNTNNNSLFTTSLNDSIFTDKYFYPGLTSGLYNVLLKDSNSCVWDTAVMVPAFIPHKPVVNFTTTNPQCWKSSFGKIKINITGDESPYTFLFEENMHSSGREVSGLLPADYPVKILNRDNCIVDSLTISLLQDADNYNCDTVYVPTAFTPNLDGKNDLLKPVIGGFPKTIFFSVYNRFGQLVFSTHKINEGWNGTYNGQPQSTGSYVWVLQYSVNNKAKLFKGTTVLIR